MKRTTPRLALCLSVLLVGSGFATAQESSVNPGINDSYKEPDAGEFTKRFETESREVFANREKIVAAAKVKPGMTVADVGAGTGLFTRLFAKAVGPEGKVYAVDIAEELPATHREDRGGGGDRQRGNRPRRPGLGQPAAGLD